MGHEVLKEHQDAVFERWFERVLDGYPEKTGTFLRSQKDPFANPVAAGLREGLGQIVSGLAEGAAPSDLEGALDRVIRVRAVQDFSPAEAVGFICDLKPIVRDVLQFEANAGPQCAEELSDVERCIDGLLLVGFDVYMRCREEVWAIRAREIRNQSVGIMERMQAWRERRVDERDNAPRDDDVANGSRS
jgi:hypothetical protein